MYQKCVNCAKSIRKIIGDFKPEIAVVLGSGLGGFADRIDVKFSVDYKDLKGFPVSTVAGHKGRFIFGNYGGKQVAVLQGRVHCYEGYSAADAVLPIRVLRLLGARTLILTNAAGGINKSFKPGDIMLITDHISLFAKSPLTGPNIDEFGTRFPDMSEVYDGGLQSIALSVAERAGIDLKQGVYVQLSGPQYESPAEVRALGILGADAVGMSTVAEAIAAKHAGMRICGLSVIANTAVGINTKPLSHKEVVDVSKSAEQKFSTLIGGIIEKV